MRNYVQGQEVRQLIESQVLELDLAAEAQGHKSSEGDGRTAADIRAELEQEGENDVQRDG